MFTFTQALARSWPLLLVTQLALLLFSHPACAQPSPRVALLMGNANYQVGKLTNPPNDVAVMEAALKAVGFKVQKVLNANQNQMKRAVRDFGTAAQGAEVAFVYYSGHGTQANGENYLLPVGATIEKESDYEVEAVSANTLLRQIQGARPKAAILVLDACRDNPLAAATKSVTKGLSRMDAPSGTMIAFATAPNAVASDNGDYAKVLAKELQKPGQELMDVFRNTTAEVRKLSGGRQEPRISEMSITDRLYLAGQQSVQVASVKPDATGAPVQAQPQPNLEQEAWELAKRRDTAPAYLAYMNAYPSGRFATLAQVALEGLRPQTAHTATVAGPRPDQVEDQLWHAAQRGGKSEVDAYLQKYPAGKYVQQANAKLQSLKPESLITEKTRSEMQGSRSLFPSGAGGSSASLSMAGNVHFDKRFNLKIQKIGDVCSWQTDFGATLFYHGAGVILAGVPDGFFVVDRNSLAVGQKFSGAIASMSAGQRLLVELTGTRLPGEIRVDVGESKDSWPEFNYPYSGTRLTIIRDYETNGGYAKSEEVAIYSSAIGCAVPVSQDITLINGNKLFGDKTRFSLKAIASEVFAN